MTSPTLEIEYRILGVLFERKHLKKKTAKTAIMLLARMSYEMYKKYVAHLLATGLIRQKKTNGRTYIEITKQGVDVYVTLRTLMLKLDLVNKKGVTVVD